VKNVTDLGSVLGASFIIKDHYILAIFFVVALHERPGSLRNFMLSFSPPFCSALRVAKDVILG